MTKENRIHKQNIKRHETAYKKIINDSYNKGEVDAKAERKISLLYEQLPGNFIFSYNFQVIIILLFLGDIIHRFFCSVDGTFNKNAYPEELKKFAVTMHFYSPKAYSFLRTTLQNALPHEKTIRKWYSSVDCDPGHLSQALQFMKKMANGKFLRACLVIGKYYSFFIFIYL